MTTIRGVKVTALDRFSDDRGTFTEIARASTTPETFVQWSHSHSNEGVLRGLHVHRNQSDLWYLASGRARIALVDLRDGEGGLAVDSWVADAVDPSTILIPPGVAHGYLALSDIDMLYMTDTEWDPDDELGIAWNDPALEIPWELSSPLLSMRDRSNPKIDWNALSFS